MSTCEAAKLLLPLRVATQEEDGGLGECPLEVHVPDLRAAGTELLAGRCVVALHQSAIGEEVLHSREATDVVDLVEDRERQDLPNTGDGDGRPGSRVLGRAARDGSQHL